MVAPCRVIVADDVADDRRLLVAALQSAGYLVTEAYDGEELYEMLTSAEPGYFRLVVTDHAMPRLFGLEVLARAGSRAPFILVTGVARPELRDAAERYGAAAFFSKPIDLDVLLETVAEIVQRTPPGGSFGSHKREA